MRNEMQGDHESKKDELDKVMMPVMKAMTEKWGSEFPDPTAPSGTRRGIDFAKVFDAWGSCLRVVTDIPKNVTEEAEELLARALAERKEARALRQAEKLKRKRSRPENGEDDRMDRNAAINEEDSKR
jgi:hypothetical protein